MPSGLSSERAAAFRPLTNSFSTSGSSLMMRTRLTGFFMERRARGKPDCLRPFGRTQRLSRHRFQTQGELALVPGRLVLVNHVLVGDAVDDAARRAQGLARGGLVAGLDRPGDALDRAAQCRMQARIVPAPLLGLTGCFARAFGVCHINYPDERAKL